jgi:nucleotide-binding universal stress UspA family protein
MNLLLAVDHSQCSETAVNAVRDRYKPTKTSVKIVHVLPWPRDMPAELAFAEGPSAARSVLDAHEDLWRAAGELVADAAAQLRAAGFDATTTIIEGDPARAILKLAAAWGADTIVLGSHGRRGVDRLLLGSVSAYVVRHAPCSVAVIRESRTAGDQSAMRAAS